MDLAQTLIRMVARAFCETKEVLVIDALMIHSALPNEDLALLLGMQQKELRKLCGKLREDRLLAVHSRQETREGQLRPVNKDYYYIDFHATIDAIKYRMFCLTEKVKNLYKPSEEKKDYHCPRCKSQWTQLEVLKNISPQGDFLCDRCSFVLERDDVSAADMAGHERQSKLMAQLNPLLKLMQQIDEEVIPQNDFDTAFSLMIPITRNEEINPLRKTEPLNPSFIGRPTSVKGMTQAAAPIEVSVMTSSDVKDERRAEAQRKQDSQAQNALPSWHTRSTVTGEMTGVGNKEKERMALPSKNTDLLKPAKAEEEEKRGSDDLNNQLAAYYLQMEKEKLKEKQDEISGSDDEDEDDFEDVVPSASGANTPSSSMSGRAINGSKAPTPTGGSTRIKAESESGSSAPGTGFNTPAASGTVADDDHGEGPAKRRKVEIQVNGVGVDKAVGETGVDGVEKEDSDEDDDVEFEDV